MRRLKKLIVRTHYKRLNTQEHVTSSRSKLLFWHFHSQLEAWNSELWISILSYISIISCLIHYSHLSLIISWNWLWLIQIERLNWLSNWLQMSCLTLITSLTEILDLLDLLVFCLDFKLDFRLDQRDVQLLQTEQQIDWWQ